MPHMAEIHFANGTVHQCRFGLNPEWRATFDPPWPQGEDGLYHPIPGVLHTPIVVNDMTGEVVSPEEWTRRLQAGEL